jgi:arylsulfatase A-like enzyme
LNRQSNSAENTWARLTASVFLAGLFSAVVEMVLVFVETPDLFSASETSLAALFELLIDWGTLIIFSTIVIAPFTFFLSSKTIADFLGGPWKLVFEIWKEPNRSNASSDEIGRLLGRVKGLLLFFALLFGGSFLVLETFHEHVRISLLIAGLGVFALILSRSVERIVTSKFIVPFLESGGVRGKNFRRVVIAASSALILSAATLCTVFADEIFGAVDVSLPVAIVLFGAALSLACALSIPYCKFISEQKWIFLFGAAVFLIGMAIIANVEGARAAISRSETLGANIYFGTGKILDFDRDGSAWLLGGDCHPFDPKSGPLAREIPGNGYDENCDGADELVLTSEYRDPLGNVPYGEGGLSKPRGNVLFVIVDATRSDHLPIYGYDRRTMSALAEFARKGVVFENFFAVSNHTSLSMPSLLTGHYPSFFAGARKVNWGSFGLPKEANSIQSRMNRLKYKTILYDGHGLWGFVRGFSFSNKDRENLVYAKDLSAMALAHLKDLGPNPKDPVLFFVHFIDPHHPYKAQSNPYLFGGGQSDKYDAELAYVDNNLSPILALMQTKEYSDWLVIVTSDHGEAFYEHGTPHHGYSLYNEEVRVPLVIRLPGARPGRVAMTASHMDLVPTIIEWTGGEPDPSLPGKSLLPLFSTKKLENSRRIVFSEFFRKGDQYGAFDGRYSLLYRKTENTYELYDNETDPTQKNNIYNKLTDPLLEAELKKHIQRSAERPPAQ